MTGSHPLHSHHYFYILGGPETIPVLVSIHQVKGNLMKKVLWALTAIMYLAGASGVFAAEPTGAALQNGSAAGGEAGAISAGTTTAVGIGVVGALAGIAVASSGGSSSGSNTATSTTVATTR